MKQDVLSQNIQDSFLYLAISNTKFLKSARNSIRPEYFSSEITENLIKICYSYFDQFNVAPDDHFHDEVVRFLANRDDKEKDRYVQYLERIQVIDSPNIDYIISRISKFVQAREFESGAIQFVKLTEKGDFEEAKELMQKVLKAGIHEEVVGLKYLSLVDEPSYYRKEVREIVFPTGFPIIDNVIGGFRRKQFGCIFAGYKVGKTWGCIHFGTQALLSGCKVLHISHESSMEEIEKRYDMGLGGLVGTEEAREINFEKVDESGNVVERWANEVDTVYNLGKVQSVRKNVSRFGGELIIQKYPMGTCTMNELDRYLDYLETFENFVPDVFINDYVEKMKLPMSDNASPRDRINQAYIDHKRIADERNIVVITASQIKVEALEKRVVRQCEAATEDTRKLGNIDIGFTFTQTRNQYAENRMQIYVLVSRSTKMYFGCMVSTNREIGQMVCDSWKLKQDVSD
jgi:replicative DNA helicase